MHYLAFVVLNRKAPYKVPETKGDWGKIMDEVDYIMAPYDENEETETRYEECWLCKGDKKYAVQDYDHRLIKPEHHINVGDVITCPECDGMGTLETTANPDGQWDWWQIGGRWTGWISGYDPEKEPENADPESPGKAKWPTQWKLHYGDVCTVDEIRRSGKNPYCVVSQDYGWYSVGDQYTFDINDLEASRENEDKAREEWPTKYQQHMAQFDGNRICVVVDFHS